MQALADETELIGFFSYSREDDTDSHGALSALRDRIQRELRTQLGRTTRDFRLWQDREAISPGTLWETEIRTAVAQAVFFIPIITPSTTRSEFCRFEFEAFLAREREIGRSDLIFPILYVRVPALEDSARRAVEPLLAMIAERQYVDWREYRHRDIYSPQVGEAVERFCAKIVDALSRQYETSAEKSQRREAEIEQQSLSDEAEARRREAERMQSEAEERRQEAERQEEAERQRQRQAAAEQRLRDAEAERLDDERRQAEVAAAERERQQEAERQRQAAAEQQRLRDAAAERLENQRREAEAAAAERQRQEAAERQRQEAAERQQQAAAAAGQQHQEAVERQPREVPSDVPDVWQTVPVQGPAQPEPTPAVPPRQSEPANGDVTPWWKEPTRRQWAAWWAGWLSWMLDGFDFILFALTAISIVKELGVAPGQMATIAAATLWMRLLGATASGWLSDRIGRRLPLMVSVLGYSVLCLLTGMSPSLAALFLFRLLFGFFMGAAWPAGAMLAMESWPARSRGLMGGLLQSAYNVGYLAALVVYSLLSDKIGWRGLLFSGMLPALLVLWIRGYVMEPEVWIAARASRPRGAAQGAPSFVFGRSSFSNTLMICWWTVSMAVVNVSISVFFGSHLVSDLHVTSSAAGSLFVGYNIATVLGCAFWGGLGDRVGRRRSMLIPAGIGIVLAPMYLLATDLTTIEAGFVTQGFFAGAAVICQLPAWLAERLPTEKRATSAGFCYHLGLVVAATAVPMAFAAAVNSGSAAGFTMPMLVGTMGGLISFMIAVLAGPETKGRDLAADP